ncbi:MAG: hypothetical protein AABY83_04125 [Pseudomonadota bacterium]
MSMSRGMQLGCLSWVLLASSAATQAGVFGGVKSEAGIWQSGLDGNLPGWSVGADLGYQHQDWFGGLGVAWGQYALPNQSNGVTRDDLDIMLGYQIGSGLSVFGGYKHIGIDHPASGNYAAFTEQIQTFGLGAQYSMPISGPWAGVFRGSANIPSTVFKSGSTSVNGNGAGFSADGGVAYWMDKATSLNAGLKMQNMQLKYTTDGTWTTTTWKAVLALNRHF